MSFQHIGHCGIGDVISDVLKCSLNAIVAPRRILSGETDDCVDDCLAWAFTASNRRCSSSSSSRFFPGFLSRASICAFWNWMICCCRSLTMPQSEVSRMCQGWSRKDMFGAENRQFPMPTGEIKRLRCETLVSRKSSVFAAF